MSHFPTTRSYRIAAFTLVELLVVIGIIALLISILIPALSKARDSAATIKCQAQLRQVGQAWIQYRNDNRDWLVPGQRKFYTSVFGGDDYSDVVNPDLIESARWYNYLAETYLKNYQVLNCPTLSNAAVLYSDSPTSYLPGTATAAVSQATVIGGTFPYTIPRGLSQGTRNEVGGGSMKWRCNYAYPRSLFGTSEESSNPGYATQKMRLPKKYSGLLAVHRYAQQNAAAARSMNLTNLIVVTDGSGWIDNNTTLSVGIYANYRWVHGGRKRINFVATDGHVQSALQGDVIAVNVAGPFAGGTATLFYAK